MNHRTTLNRRRFVLAAGALGAIPMAGNVAAQSLTPEASLASGAWTYTDAKGVTTTLPQRPERIVMDVNAASALWDFVIKPTALFGWNVYPDGSLGAAGGNIDPAGIPTVGNESEPINLEQTIAQEPDLIITLTWVNDADPTEYWSIDAAVLPQVQAIAPIIAMSATGRADDNTLAFADLAALLGADLDTPELAESRTDMETAIARLQSVASARTDPTSMYVHPSEDKTYVAFPADWSDLNMYMQLGQNVYEPDVEPGMFWEEFSHELAAEYPSDLLFTSTRPASMTPEALAEHPSWSQHPAVKAGQVYSWNQDFIMSYQGMAEAITGIAEALERAQKVT